MDDLSLLPPFYASLLRAWIALHGSLTPSGLAFGGSQSIESISRTTCYQLLLSFHDPQPHCVAEFFHSFGPLEWLTTRKTLHFMPLDRQVIDLNWKVAHGVLYTVEHLTFFGYSLPLECFCGNHLESLEHLFSFLALWCRAVMPGSNRFWSKRVLSLLPLPFAMLSLASEDAVLSFTDGTRQSKQDQGEFAVN